MCLIITERMLPQFLSRILRTSPEPKKFLSHGLREQQNVRRSVRMERGGLSGMNTARLSVQKVGYTMDTRKHMLIAVDRSDASLRAVA